MRVREENTNEPRAASPAAAEGHSGADQSSGAHRGLRTTSVSPRELHERDLSTGAVLSATPLTHQKQQQQQQQQQQPPAALQKGENAKMGNSFSNISAFQSLHIVMLGLDSAGKTTVLYRLKFNEFVNTVPTIGFNTEKIKLSNGTAKGISCHFWDVGGQEKLRPLWKSYSRCTDGIIYVVDSVDVDRLEEAKTELHKVTKFAENQGTPLLVIANKQDLPKSLPVADIEKQLALHELSPSTAYHIQPACAIIGEGLHEGMDKLYEMILKRRKSLKQKKKR
ncbi:ADP-ribosylation factor-like protein 4C [Pseudoliparis swirei]|uniref:ADP-ribosylation factor-like protein 4C n=1 Tax=Pseudoliparis swirei TaxID=2059687 RepID=UPI0024BD7A76|nr:ADP-ribosylation factor-like protein 4C [Pseudoliparis swirei]